jgi:hypothetical protein
MSFAKLLNSRMMKMATDRNAEVFDWLISKRLFC